MQLPADLPDLQKGDSHMSTFMRNHQPFHSRPQKRMLLISTGLLLLTLVAALMILNVLGIVPLLGTWLAALEIAFATLGVIIAYCQWVLPVSSPLTVDTSLDDHTQQPVLTSGTNHDLEVFRQQVEGALDRRLRKGALIVLTSDDWVAHEIKVASQLAWVHSANAYDHLSEVHKETVKRYRVDTGYICAAVYRYLAADDYMVWSDTNQPTSVPVFANEAMIVDWR
jgi:hypothetical protein